MTGSKVLMLPIERQRNYTPACDSSTIEVLASRHDDKILNKLLELNSISTICRNFLRESEVDKDGKVVGEQGLHYWLASDDAIHTMSSCTETGRPRS